MKPLSECRLYTFVDSAYLRGRDPLELTRELCEGGSDLIQLRAKDWPLEKIRDIGRRVLEVANSYQVRLVINDHLSIAQEIGASFCHLGQEDFFDSGYAHVSELPAMRNQRVQVGISTHAASQAERALAAGADYIAVGPVFHTGTKPTARPVTLEYVRWATANVGIPWFAIGGITLLNLPEVLMAGAKRICVVSAILSSKDTQATCRQFKRMLE